MRFLHVPVVSGPASRRGHLGRGAAALLLVVGALAATAGVASAASPDAQAPALSAAGIGTSSNDTPAPCPTGQTPICPSDDPFFAAPSNLAGLADGAIIRSRPETVTSPNGPPGVGSAYLLVYKSTDSFGAPVADVTTVLLPAVPYAGTGSTPLMTYQTPEDSLGRQCAVSYALQNGTNANTSGELPFLSEALAQGWVVAAPDYEGPAEQFIAGPQAGHAVLDGIRATEAFTPAGLNPKTPTGIFGYSGGGFATGWAAELKTRYAPELNLVGVAEGGVPADLKAVSKANDGTVSSGLVLLATEGLDRAYPAAGIYGLLNAAGRAAFATLAPECVGAAVSGFALKTLDSYTTAPDAVDSPTLAPVLAANDLGSRPIPVPLYDYHGLADEIVPESVDMNMVADYCSLGVSVTQVLLPAEHISADTAGGSGAIAWLASRFAGVPAVSTCATTGASTTSSPSPSASPAATTTSTSPAAGNKGSATRSKKVSARKVTTKARTATDPTGVTAPKGTLAYTGLPLWPALLALLAITCGLVARRLRRRIT